MHYPSAQANAPEQKSFRKELRHKLTPTEATLWKRLKNKGAGDLKFRRQQGVGPYILDFYCPELRIDIELDGTVHDTYAAYEYDKQRTAFLQKQDIRVIRFRNEQVWSNIDAVVEEILRVSQEIRSTSYRPHPCPSP